MAKRPSRHPDFELGRLLGKRLKFMTAATLCVRLDRKAVDALRTIMDSEQCKASDAVRRALRAMAAKAR